LFRVVEHKLIENYLSILQTHPPVPLVYLYINNQQAGPYALDQLKAMWNSGSITADTPYWHEGMAEWAPVHTLLSSEQDAPQPPPLPPSPPQQKIFKAQYDPNSDSFMATMQLMVKLAMKAIQELGWKLENANESIGLVTFETGMSWGSFSGVSCSLNIDEVDANCFRVAGTGKQNVRGGQFAAIDLFGEAKGKAQKAIDKMKELAT
jgi:hypothetical protein